MACCGQSGADRFSNGEIEDRRAARAAAVGDRDRDPARAPGSDGLGGVLWKDGRPPILGEQPAGRATNGDVPFRGHQFALQHRHRLGDSRQVPYAPLRVPCGRSCSATSTRPELGSEWTTAGKLTLDG
jgi:hypothetical protein